MDTIDESDRSARHFHADATSYISAEDDRSTEGEWRNIIFVPFDKRWEFLIIVLVLIQTTVILYEIFFGYLDVGNYLNVIEAVYACDTILSIMHRYLL